MKIIVDAAVQTLFEARGVTLADIEEVLARVEATGEVFENGRGRLLACRQPGEVTFWVEYVREDDGYRICRVYAHRMKIIYGFNLPPRKKEASDWVCVPCGIPLETATVKLAYLDETFAADIPACPSCQRVLVSEEVAVGKMALAEKMLEDK